MARDFILDGSYEYYQELKRTYDSGEWRSAAQRGKLSQIRKTNFEDIQIVTYEEVWPIIPVIEDGNYGAIDYNGKMVIESEIMSGNYSSLALLQRETFTYYLNDNGETVFISHLMTDRPEMNL